MIMEVYPMRPLISIITPTYQSERYLMAAIHSVQRQTYQHWELLLADDYSTDGTRRMILEAAKADTRIRPIFLPENGGAAKARNAALSRAKGRYVAYLDADDLWKPEKLERQLHFMEKSQCGFSCVSYQVISDGGKLLGKTVVMKPRLNYEGYLKNNLIQTVGVMVDCSLVPARLLLMPDLRRRQDAATWMQILREGHDCYGMTEPLAYYRRAKGSLSSNKLRSVTGTWFLYRKVAGLQLSRACLCFLRYALLAIWKRIYLWPATGERDGENGKTENTGSPCNRTFGTGRGFRSGVCGTGSAEEKSDTV